MRHDDTKITICERQTYQKHAHMHTSLTTVNLYCALLFVQSSVIDNIIESRGI